MLHKSSESDWRLKPSSPPVGSIRHPYAFRVPSGCRGFECRYHRRFRAATYGGPWEACGSGQTGGSGPRRSSASSERGEDTILPSSSSASQAGMRPARSCPPTSSAAARSPTNSLRGEDSRSCDVRTLTAGLLLIEDDLTPSSQSTSCGES